jgi:hypothetical protein
MDETGERIREMNEEEIFRLFERYDFRNRSGHRLTDSPEFRELLRMAVTGRRTEDVDRAIEEDPLGSAE